MKTFLLSLLSIYFCIFLFSCGENPTDYNIETSASILEPQPPAKELAELFNQLPQNLSNSYKIWGHKNPLLTQSFLADPSVMEYNGRIYIYGSNDTFVFDDNDSLVANEIFKTIQGIRIISSSDMVNWTDHGVSNITGTQSTNPLIATPSQKIVSYAGNAWSPSCIWKEVNGKPKFFLYWTDLGATTSVVTADSPIGPWINPGLTNSMIRYKYISPYSHWFFDPDLFIDTDGKIYMVFAYLGEFFNNVGRLVLNDDMISGHDNYEGINIPLFIEGPGLWKWNGTYYLNYTVRRDAGNDNAWGLKNNEIAYVTNTEGPLGSWSEPKGLMAPGADYISNHASLFDFKGKPYIIYHSIKHAKSMGIPAANYRTAHIDNITVNTDGSLERVTPGRTSVEQAGYLDPYLVNKAVTMAVQGGIYTCPDSESESTMIVTSIDSGDWTGLYGVDFGNMGASKFTARVKMPETPVDYTGGIEIRINPKGIGVTEGDLSPASTAGITGGEVIGRIKLKAKSGEEGKWAVAEASLYRTITGVHDIVFVFYTSTGENPEVLPPAQANDHRHRNGFEFKEWWFNNER